MLSDGTDLTVGVEGRTWIAAKGDRNFPDGEVFTGPVETATNGEVRFSFPAVMGGREVEDVRLRFEDGRVVKSEAASGEEYLRQMLAMDDGATVLGEFAIGTNYAVKEFTRQILFDEKIGGTCHMALGAGYPDTGQHQRLRAPLGHGVRPARRAPRSTPTASRSTATGGSSRRSSTRTSRSRPDRRPEMSHPMRATCAMNGRSWRRRTSTPR